MPTNQAWPPWTIPPPQIQHHLSKGMQNILEAEQNVTDTSGQEAGSGLPLLSSEIFRQSPAQLFTALRFLCGGGGSYLIKLVPSQAMFSFSWQTKQTPRISTCKPLTVTKYLFRNIPRRTQNKPRKIHMRQSWRVLCCQELLHGAIVYTQSVHLAATYPMCSHPFDLPFSFSIYCIQFPLIHSPSFIKCQLISPIQSFRLSDATKTQEEPWSSPPLHLTQLSIVHLWEAAQPDLRDERALFLWLPSNWYHEQH